jgi:Ca2+-binding RTX toxin-like protein
VATFDFHRVKAGVNSDSALKMVTNYSAIKQLPISGASDTDFILSAANSTKWKFHGEDFDYNSKGDPTKGVIHSINVTAPAGHPELTFEITDVSIDIAALKAAFTTSSPLDDLALVAGIFDGNDTFVGSRGKDKFYGLKGKDTMTGSDGKDSLDGGAGGDLLDGGRHADRLTGGGGKDKFTFSNAISAGDNVDVITDFNPTDDTIRLDAGIFTNLGAAGTTLDAARLVFGPSTTDAPGTNIVYDTTTGDLFFEKGHTAYKFAHLDGAPTLTNADFVIV